MFYFENGSERTQHWVVERIPFDLENNKITQLEFPNVNQLQIKVTVGNNRYSATLSNSENNWRFTRRSGPFQLNVRGDAVRVSCSGI